MRTEHLIRAARSDCYPSHIISLACDCVWEQRGGSIYSETARLRGWVAVGSSGAAGVYGADREFSGTTAADFWEKLRAFLGRRSAASIYCERAGITCSLLDLWGAVQRREVDLCGTDERGSNGGRSNRRNPRRMRVVLEDPPIIIEGKMCGASGKFKILDMANFGLQPSPDGTPVTDGVARVARFVRGMVEAIKLHGLGSLKDTAGSQSMHSFRRKHLTHSVLCHDNERALNLEGDSYYGGRCEAFRIGRVVGNVYHLDVSSMYAYCYGNSEIPTSLAGCANALGEGDQPQLGQGSGLIADVTVETDEPAYPFRDVSRGIIIYPIGVYRTILAGPELQDALAKDRVVRWHRASWYCMKPALASYSQCVLDMRREYADNADLKTWVKSLGVCLVGKLGQKDHRWVDATSNVFHGPWQMWWEVDQWGQSTRWRSISGYTQMETVSSWNYDAAPAIASWVTSLARVRLLQMIRCASWEETYYCDTDALMVSKKGYLALKSNGWVRDNEPGFLRVKNVSNTVEVHGVKSYDEDGRRVRSGCPLSRAWNFLDEQRYWAKRPAYVSYREGRPPQAQRVAIKHTPTTPYKHGEVCADGSVTPIQLNEG